MERLVTTRIRVSAPHSRGVTASSRAMLGTKPIRSAIGPISAATCSGS
jgi:hypothetical protein